MLRLNQGHTDVKWASAGGGQNNCVFWNGVAKTFFVIPAPQNVLPLHSQNVMAPTHQKNYATPRPK